MTEYGLFGKLEHAFRNVAQTPRVVVIFERIPCGVTGIEVQHQDGLQIVVNIFAQYQEALQTTNMLRGYVQQIRRERHLVVAVRIMLN